MFYIFKSWRFCIHLRPVAVFGLLFCLLFSEKAQSAFGEVITSYLEIVKTYKELTFGTHLAISVNSMKEIFVADADKHRLLKVDPVTNTIEVVKINLAYKDKPFTPYGIFVDSSDNMYVTNPDLHTLLIIDAGGNIKKRIGGFNSILKRPIDIALDKDSCMYVLDAIGTYIHIFDPDGNSVKSILIGDTLKDASVTAIGIDSMKNIFITDRGASRILKISPSWKISSFEIMGYKNEQPISPMGIAIGKEDTVFITDYLNNALYQYDNTGNLIRDHLLIKEFLEQPSAITFREDTLYIINKGKNEILQFELKYAVNGIEHELLGERFFEKGLYHEAIPELKTALELGNNFSDVYYFLGLSFYHMDKFQESIPYLTKALEKHPEDVDAFFQLGNAYYKIKNLQGAVENYQRVLHSKPDHTLALYNIAEVYLEAGDLEKSERLFRNAVQISPDYTDAKIGLGRVLLEKCKNESAEDIFSEILMKTPEVRQARYFLGLAFFNQQKYEKAIDTFSLVSQEGPYYLDALYYLGLSYKSMGKYQKARENFEKILSIKPDHPGVREQLRK